MKGSSLPLVDRGVDYVIVEFVRSDEIPFDVEGKSVFTSKDRLVTVTTYPYFVHN